MFEDTYKTVVNTAEGVFKDKGSKFLSFVIPVKSEEEIKEQLAILRKLHPSARHHCYAFRLGADKQAYRANDDGEPSNTAGKPILGQIQSKDLTNVLIVVVRYFGGTLLGVGGLITAYKNAAADGIANATIVERTVNDVYEVKFDYLQMNEVMKLLKDEKAELIEQEMELNCRIVFSIRKMNSVKLFDEFKKMKSLEIVYLRTN